MPNEGDDSSKGISAKAVLYPLEYAIMSGGEKGEEEEEEAEAVSPSPVGAAVGAVSMDDDDPPAATDESSRGDDDDDGVGVLRGMGRRGDGSRRQ